MIVMKFGGTSVEDADALRNVSQIISDRLDRTPLVVVSACAGVTNLLLHIARTASEGKTQDALAGVEKLRKRHFGIADELLTSKPSAFKEFTKQFDDLGQLAQSIAVIQEVTPRLLDQFAACGERWSSWLLVHALIARGMRAQLCDAREVMITTDEFTRAEPLFDLIESNSKKRIQPALRDGVVVVTQGFVGATQKGVTTTLGRGGSDYSAAIFGAALDAEEIQIWTDVDGVLSADPSILPDAHLISELTFNEAAELAYFGAKVLHPSTILPAMKKNIPVRVLNSKRPNIQGTRITTESIPSSNCMVKSIAYKGGITVITIQSTRMLMAYGFLARVFDIFKHYKKSIDLVATSEVGVSLTVDNDSDIENIVDELRTFADVIVERNKAVCCVVGENMKYTTGVAGRVFDALGRAGVNVELISHGGSEINLTFVISESQVRVAVASLHKELFADAHLK